MPINECTDIMDVHVGVDVGGTNTDAVVLHAGKVVGSTKQFTTEDVTTGVTQAITAALEDARKNNKGIHGWFIGYIPDSDLYCLMEQSFNAGEGWGFGGVESFWNKMGRFNKCYKKDVFMKNNRIWIYIKYEFKGFFWGEGVYALNGSSKFVCA